MQKRLRWYVATYGDLGIEISFFSVKREYERAEKEAEREHARGNFDTYTCGEIS